MRILCHIHIFQIRKKSRSFIPVNRIGFLCYIISFRCGNRNNLNCLKIQFTGKFLNLFFDFIKTLFTVINQIHFINSKYKRIDSHQRTNSRMTSCLNQNTLCGINQNNCQIRKGSTYCHVSCILFMTRRICYNKTSLICRKIAVCHVNRNSLLSLCHQSVKQERIINRTAAASDFTVKFQRFFLIGIKKF